MSERPDALTRASTTRSKRLRAIRSLATAAKYAAAWVASTAAIYSIVTSRNDLGRISSVSDIFEPATAPTWDWAFNNFLFAASLLLWAGRRRDRVLDWVDHRQMYGVLWMGLFMSVYAGLFFSLQYADPDRQCIRAGCWPSTGVYAALVLAPCIVALIVMLVQCFLPVRWPWWGRSLPAPTVFVLASAVQVLLWEDHAVPFLLTPP